MSSCSWQKGQPLTCERGAPGDETRLRSSAERGAGWGGGLLGRLVWSLPSAAARPRAFTLSPLQLGCRRLAGHACGRVDLAIEDDMSERRASLGLSLRLCQLLLTRIQEVPIPRNTFELECVRVCVAVSFVLVRGRVRVVV